MTAATLVRPPGSLPNDLPWKPYTYQGTGTDTLTPELGDAFDDEPQDVVRAREEAAGLKPHGTPAAYRRHLRHGERACRECLDGEAERQRQAKGSPAYAARRRERYATAVAAGLSAPQALKARDRGLRCGGCGYLFTTASHKITCGDA